MRGEAHVGHTRSEAVAECSARARMPTCGSVCGRATAGSGLPGAARMVWHYAGDGSCRSTPSRRPAGRNTSAPSSVRRRGPRPWYRRVEQRRRVAYPAGPYGYEVGRPSPTSASRASSRGSSCSRRPGARCDARRRRCFGCPRRLSYSPRGSASTAREGDSVVVPEGREGDEDREKAHVITGAPARWTRRGRRPPRPTTGALSESIAQYTSRPSPPQERDCTPMPTSAAPTRRVTGSTAVHPNRRSVASGATIIGTAKSRSATK